jgi:hypothetical protein
MITANKSTGINNYGQLRHYRCTLCDRGVGFHKVSANVMNFGFPIIWGFVPLMLNSLYSPKLL